MEIIFWLCVMMVLAVLETFTVSLVCIWFAIGSLVAFVAALLGAPIWAQAALCLSVGIVLLALTRPLAMRYVNSKRVATNADRVLGQIGKVTETIDNTSNSGAVYVLGKEWSARSVSGEIIEPGTLVHVETLEGVKLWVVTAAVPATSNP